MTVGVLSAGDGLTRLLGRKTIIEMVFGVDSLADQNRCFGEKIMQLGLLIGLRLGLLVSSVVLAGVGLGLSNFMTPILLTAAGIVFVVWIIVWRRSLVLLREWKDDSEAEG